MGIAVFGVMAKTNPVLLNKLLYLLFSVSLAAIPIKTSAQEAKSIYEFASEWQLDPNDKWLFTKACRELKYSSHYSDYKELCTLGGVLPNERRVQIPVVKRGLIVTHANSFFDKGRVAQIGINQILTKFRKQNRPIVFLMSVALHEGSGGWYTDQKIKPTAIEFSEAGEHSFESSGEITLVGGFWGHCHGNSIQFSIKHFSYENGQELNIHLPTTAIYFVEEYGRSPILLSQALIRHGFYEIFKELNTLFVGSFGDSKLDLSLYTIRFFIDDGLQSPKIGNGSRIVNLKLGSSI